MNRLIPSPLLSVVLWVLWVLLVQSLSPGTLALGLLLALFWPAATAGLRPGTVRVRRPMCMVRLFARVVLEMLRSNGQVALAMLTHRRRDIRSGFVEVPLELRDPYGLAVLAMILTFTPGTAWVQLSPQRDVLLLHVLAIKDKQALVQFIQHHYERPLMEIFQ